MTFLRSMSPDKRNILVLSIVFLLAFVGLFKPWVHGVDPVGYYSWLRSAVIDGNLNTANEYEFLGIGSRIVLLDTGYHANPFSVGSAVLWAPFFLVAHAVTLLLRHFGANWSADGYGTQYVVAISLGSALYAFLGLLLTYKVARRYFAPRVALTAVIAVWLASPLVFYQFSNPAMSHANDAFGYALFLFAWVRLKDNSGWPGYAFLGAAGGLCALIRLQNAVLVVLPFVDIAVRAFQAAKRHNWLYAIRQGLVQTACFSGAWWLVFAPQLLTWHTVFGEWLVGNPYASARGGDFSFLQIHILEILFSSNRGLFLWTPLLFPATVGWIFLWKQERRLAAFIVVNFALQLLLLGFWSGWAGGAAYGQRKFVNMVPAFALGLAALLDVLALRLKFRWLSGACVMFVVWNGLLILRYVLQDIPREGYVPLEQLIVGQFTVLPRCFPRIIELLFRRS